MPPIEGTILPEASAETPIQPPVSFKNTSRWKAHELVLTSVFAILIGWWALGASGWISPIFLPGPGQVFAKFMDIATTGFMDASLLQHIAASLAGLVSLCCSLL